MSTGYQARKKQAPADPNITFFMDRFRKNITGQPIEELKPDSDEEAAQKAKEAEEEQGEEEYEEGAGEQTEAAAEAEAEKAEGEKAEAEKAEGDAQADTEEAQPEAEGEAAEGEAAEGEAEGEEEEGEGGEEEEGEEEEGEEEAEGEEAEGAEAQGGTGAAEQPKDEWTQAAWPGQAGVEEYWVNNAQGKGPGTFYAMQRMQEWNEAGWPAWPPAGPPEAGNWGPEFDDVDASSWFGSKEAYYQAIGKRMPPSEQCATAEGANKETDAKAASGEEAKVVDNAPVAEEAGECLDCTLIEDGLAQDDPFSVQQSAVPTESSKVTPTDMEVDKDNEAKKRPISVTIPEDDLKRQKLAAGGDDVELLPLSRKPLDEVMILEHGYNGDETDEEDVAGEAPQSPREIMNEANTAIATFLEDMPSSPKSAALSPRSPKSSCPGSPRNEDKPPAVEESPKEPIAQPTMPVTKESDREVDDRVSFQSMDHRDALLAEWEHIVPGCLRGMNCNKVRCCVKPCDREWYSSDLAARDPVNKYVEHYLMEHIVLDGEREMTEKVSIPTNGRCRYVHVLASCDMCCGQVQGIFEWNENYHFRRLCIQCHRIHSRAVSSLKV